MVRGESKGKTEVMKHGPGQAEKSSQPVWIGAVTLPSSVLLAVIPGRSGVRQQAGQGFEMQARKSSFQVRIWISRTHLRAQTG